MSNPDTVYPIAGRSKSKSPVRGATRRNYSDTLLNNIKDFNGKSDINDWIDEFELITEATGLDDIDRFRRLPLYLKGPAKDWYTGSIRIKPVDQRPATYQQLKSKLLAAFKRTNFRTNTLRITIDNKRQHENQDVFSYIFEMIGLCAKYNPQMNFDEKLHYIKNGLLPGILTYIALQRINDLDELKSKAEEAEYYYRKSKNDEQRYRRNGFDENAMRSSYRPQFEQSKNYNFNQQWVNQRQPYHRQQFNRQPRYSGNNYYPNQDQDYEQTTSAYMSPPQHNYFDEQRADKGNYVIRQEEPKVSQQKEKENESEWSPQIKHAGRLINTVVAEKEKHKLIIIDVLINDTPMKAMVDTGAEISLMSIDSINKINLELKKYKGPPTTAVDNKKMEPLGQAKVDVNINDGTSTITIRTNVMVINELPAQVDLIIGQDVSELADLIINVRKQKVFIASIPEDYRTINTSTYLDEVVEDLVIMNLNLNEQKPSMESKDRDISTNEDKDKLQIINKNEDTLKLIDHELTADINEHAIDSENENLTNMNSYRQPIELRSQSNEINEGLRESGYIHPPFSSCVSPVAIITKKKAGPKNLGSLNLHSGYHQIKMVEEDISKTTFVKNLSEYEPG